MGGSTKDAAGTSLPPPLTYLIGLLLGIPLGLVIPVQFLPGGLGPIVGLPIAVVGLYVLPSAARAFSRNRTSVVPTEPTTKIVQEGPYSFSRNPIYLSFALIYLGIALAFSSFWAVVFLVPIMVFIDRGQIVREEKYLEKKFGDEYVQYKSRVRRWI